MFCGGFHAHSHLLCKATFIFILLLVLVIDLALHSIESKCVLKGTVTSGCSAYYALYQWTFYMNKKEVISNKLYNKAFSVESAGELVADDYFVMVTYPSGGINNGTLTLSKKQ